MTERCPGGWFGRHKLEPRYDANPAQPVSVEQIEAISAAVLFSDDTRRTIKAVADGGHRYVHDICVRCGRTFPDVSSTKLTGE